MKQKLKLLMLMLITCNIASVYGQEKKDGKIVVEITKDINGEKRTFKGEYENKEQMKADPNYQEFAGEDDKFDFWFDGELDEDNMAVHLDHLRGTTNSFKFFDSEDEANVFFKHFGEEGEEGNHFFEHFNFDSTGIESFHFNDLKMEELSEKMKDFGIELEMLMEKIGNRDSRVNIITLKRVHISDVSGDEFGKKGKVSENSKLLLEDLSFSPNPSSNGRFKVKFKVPEEKDLAIRVYNLDGKEVFNRYFESFGGLYAETIDLSSQKEGIYLLEITQGGKHLTKKIAIN